MINRTLYFREMRNSIKILLFFLAVITLYVTMIISIYNPEMMSMLENFSQFLPKFTSAVGMSPGANSLIGFMISYLYGFILLIFPMVFSIIRGNGLVSKYVESGSMVTLLAAPVKRRSVATTQALVLLSGILFLILYTTLLQWISAEIYFPGQVSGLALCTLNVGLLSLQLFIGGICFFTSCYFSGTKWSLAFGAGIPGMMYVLKMLANVGGNAENMKYLTFFTLFDPNGLNQGEMQAVIGTMILFFGSCLLFSLGILSFCKKDLHI